MTAATAGLYMALTVAVPLAFGAAAFVLSQRTPGWLTPLAAGVTLAIALALTVAVAKSGMLEVAVGGWVPPLGIVWRLDGLSAVLMSATAVVGGAVTWFIAVHEHEEERIGFRPLFLFLWSALNAVYLSGDVFNLYVTLELTSLAAVALASLEGSPQALRAALRYLFFALFGSLSYLLGVALLYAGFGTLDLQGLGRVVEPGVPALAAMVLMTVGLFAKAALFPLHTWLPPAHGSAPAPASALLSGVVIMATFLVLLRLWLGVFAPLAGDLLPQLLGALGAFAVLWGSLLALREKRLKLLVAYSTVAQFGYLLLIPPLLNGPWARDAVAGGLFLAVAHAFAKAAMFLAAGVIMAAFGHDRIAGLRGAAQHAPMTVFAIGLAGLTLMGLPPSGGFAAKWLMLQAAVESRQWWWALVLLGGGLLAAAYVFRVLVPAFRHHPRVASCAPVPRTAELVVLALGLASLALGMLSAAPVRLLQQGVVGAH